MLQSANISDRVKSIVANFFSPAKNDNIFVERSKVFIVSLYATMPQAQTEVGALIMSTLRTYETDLLDYMTTDDLRILQTEYSAVIQYCYEVIDKTGLVFVSLSGYLGRVPKEIIDLCLSISEPSDGSSVYLPFAGESQFGIYLPNCLIEGFESNKEEWAFSQILLDSKRINSHIENREPDTVLHSGEKQYDYIFTAPPFVAGNDLMPIVNELYHLATKALKTNGEMYCILPMSFCFASSGFFALRKVLIDYHGLFSAAVISLPKDVLMPRSSVNICLFALFKDHKNRVMLVDATSSEFMAKHDVAGIKRYELKVQAILETIEKHDSNHMWVGYPTELTDFLNLTPSRYLIEQTLPKPKLGENLIALSDIIEIVPKERFEAPVEGYKFIDMKQLSSNYLNCTVDNNSLGFSKSSNALSAMTRIRKSARYTHKISDNQSLLFAYHAGKVYVGRLTGLDNSTVVAISNNILPFKLKTAIVTEEFLLRSLLSNTVLKQIEMLSGSTHDQTRAKDFLSIKIIVPSIEEQNRLCREDTRISLTEADKKLLESIEDYRRDVNMKKHAIGQTIAHFNNWWKILLRARKAGNGVLRDTDIVGVSSEYEVSAVFENLQNIMNKLQMQISRFDRSNGLEITHFALTEFIEQFISLHISPRFRYIYDATTHRATQDIPVIDVDEEIETATVHNDEYAVKDGDPIEYVDFAPDALSMVFDNIISNACSHGFIDMEPDRCFIKFEISTEGTDHIILVSNNGKPITDKIAQDEIYLYGRTTDPKTHSGIGVYEIRQLMRKYNGDVRVVSTPSEEFTVTYQLIFHNTNILYSI